MHVPQYFTYSYKLHINKEKTKKKGEREMSVYWKHLHMLHQKAHWADFAVFIVRCLPARSIQCLLENLIQ